MAKPKSKKSPAKMKKLREEDLGKIDGGAEIGGCKDACAKDKNGDVCKAC